MLDVFIFYSILERYVFSHVSQVTKRSRGHTWISCLIHLHVNGILTAGVVQSQRKRRVCLFFLCVRFSAKTIFAYFSSGKNHWWIFLCQLSTNKLTINRFLICGTILPCRIVLRRLWVFHGVWIQRLGLLFLFWPGTGDALPLFPSNILKVVGMCHCNNHSHVTDWKLIDWNRPNFQNHSRSEQRISMWQKLGCNPFWKLVLIRCHGYTNGWTLPVSSEMDGPSPP